jgi:homoserine dehydrogenase
LKAVKIGLIGLGTVGGGTLNLLARNAAEIARRAGRKILVTHAAAREYDPDSLDGLDNIDVSDDAFSVVENSEVDIVVELMGGYSPALELVLKAIENGKHVVTANKALIAVHGNEIFEAAQARGVTVAFEAAVAGGIPIIKALREGLVANHIEWIAGIINGTGNFILTEMKDKSRDFADVLKEAQALGYAEADPTFDVEGIDAAHKLTILASLAFGIPLQFDKCYTEGIAKIEPLDIDYAGQFGYRIKHLGITRMTEAGIELRVHPTLIPEKRLIANVDGVMNAVLVRGDAVGSTLYYGAGAGSMPTASAVVADIVDVVRVLTSDPGNRVPHLAFQPDALSDVPVADMDDVHSAYYMRLALSDESGVLAKVTELLGESSISIEAFLQKPSPADADSATVVVLTKVTREGDFNAVLDKIRALPSVVREPACFRVESLA